MIVAKFGGSSVQDGACLRRAVAIVRRQHRRGPVVVVVSAVAGVTRRLLRLGEMAAAGDDGVARELDCIAVMHRGILADIAGGGEPGRGDAAPAVASGPMPGRSAAVTPDAASGGLNQAVRARLQRLLEARLDKLRDAVAVVSARRAYPPARQDAVIGCGEPLSTVLFEAAGLAAGLDVRGVEAAGIIVTDDRFRDARPDLAAIAPRAHDRLNPHILAGRVPVIEGFIGATPAGEPTTMGFEASDLTATLLGAALGAREVQIWTDVPGMLTACHAAVPSPRVVPWLSYAEARELARFGAKVLHPDTVAPARDAGIPVRILSSREPAREGTWITARGAVPDGAGDDVSGWSPPAGFAKAIAVRANGRGETVVCPVGEGIGADESVQARVATVLAGIPWRRWREDHDGRASMPIVVPDARAADCLRRLHELLVVDLEAVARR